ncbi:hypothetical protein [Aquibaculum arenosum]|uniref:DUF3558 domain-containing protein n=1 Tax=Aquibaculum arenosum TaxID=3032591 RepID=A0ABT5YL34_9PROT|nr:hypothetical protein [Fodinicurvata sp. CAU 1616]MDF2094974.1 hypothetical protein [Fodinicurvata sp. CAU 1616]
MHANFKAPTRLALLALPFLLAACSSNDGPDVVRSCPGLVGLDDAMEQTHFLGGGRDLTDVDFTARIEDVRYGCIYEEDEGTILTELLVQISAARGPANQDNRANVAYFIAVGEQQEQGPPEILLREGYQATAEFQGNQTSILLNDELTLRIPARSDQRGDDFTIFVGLVLDEAEVEYNRRQMQ